jgi:hypothetical protein
LATKLRRLESGYFKRGMNGGADVFLFNYQVGCPFVRPVDFPLDFVTPALIFFAQLNPLYKSIYTGNSLFSKGKKR